MSTTSDLGGNEPHSQASGRRRQISKLKIAIRALQHRNYRLFFAGQCISLIGTWMQIVAQSWLVYRLTGSSFLLGSVGFASQIPVFLLALVGGTVADRYNRHRVLIATQASAMLLALILSMLTLMDVVRVWHIFILSALLGVVNAFDMPTRQAFIVEMVGKEDLMNAIALNSSLFNSARVLGPAMAGLIVAGIGEGWCFFVNAVSYLATIIGLLLMRITAQAKPARIGSPLNNILEGFRFVKRTRPIRALLLMLAMVSILGMPYSVLMPIFADQILHGGARGLGILMGASGLGALIGALFLATRSDVQSLSRWVGYACAGFGCSLMLFSASRFFWLSVLLLLPAGFSLMVQMASSNTLIQTMVPDHLRGRTMAVHAMMFMGMAPFGSFFAGVIAEKLGVSLTVSIGALVCLAGAVVFIMRLPVLGVVAQQIVMDQDMIQADHFSERQGIKAG